MYSDAKIRGMLLMAAVTLAVLAIWQALVGLWGR